MRFFDRLAVVVLIALGLGLALANLWVTAARSTIPLTLQTRLLNREIRREKHPGQDDVHLWMLDDRRTLHVDAAVYSAVPHVGARLEKHRGDRVLRVGDRAVSLDWSADFRGMARVMPVLMLALLVWAPCALAGPTDGSKTQADS